MAFMDIELPVKISLGTASAAMFQTDVVVYGNGKEYRNKRWDYQKAEFDISYVVKNRADAIEVYNFFLAAEGRFNTFRVLDRLDMSSAADGASTPTAVDQVIATADGATAVFQTTKTYSNGVSSYNRKITKPRDNGTFKLAVDGIETTNFTIDYTTGIITLGFLPTSGQVVTAGYEFNIHCRFDVDGLQGIQHIFLRKDSDKDFFNFPSLPIVEVLD